jgi:hypothetical protein
MSDDWWRQAIGYQVYLPSFAHLGRAPVVHRVAGQRDEALADQDRAMTGAARSSVR